MPYVIPIPSTQKEMMERRAAMIKNMQTILKEMLGVQNSSVPKKDDPSECNGGLGMEVKA